MNAEQFSASGPGAVGEILTTPTPARVYNYLLDGKDHLPADRDFGERLKKVRPDVVEAVHANRAFLRRAVAWLARQGVDQFIEVGAGIPRSPNVHEVAQQIHPGARVVYVDNDPVVLAHANALLAGIGFTSVMQADIRDPAAIVEHCQRYKLIDFDRRVAVLLVAVLHFVSDEDDPYGITERLRKAMVSGSHLAISHAVPAPGVEKVAAMYTAEATEPGVPRTPEQIGRFFKGFDLEDPRVVPVNRWRPGRDDPDTSDVWVHGGVGRKP